MHPLIYAALGLVAVLVGHGIYRIGVIAGRKKERDSWNAHKLSLNREIPRLAFDARLHQRGAIDRIKDTMYAELAAGLSRLVTIHMKETERDKKPIYRFEAEVVVWVKKPDYKDEE